MREKSLSRFLVLCFFSLAIGCNWLVEERPEIHSIEAEIVGIEKASDTSVLVHIEVLKNGNSEGCSLWIYFDTTTVKRGISARSRPVTASVLSDCQLEKVYAITVSPLKNGQEYFFQLFQHAFWYPSGTTSYRDQFIGTPQKFTIQ